MARVALVSYDLETIAGKSGGVAAFCTRFARLLKAAGEDVTLIMTRADKEPKCVDTAWKARYSAEGIGLIEIQIPEAVATRWPEVPAMRVSELVAPVLANFDIAYFQDWGNAAFHSVRERRYKLDQGPVCVTVLHGPSEWELSSNHKFPRLPDDLHLAYLERYSAKHSDFVVSPSRYMIEHLRALGWEYPHEPEALGLPMPPRETAPAPAPARIDRIVYFGRIEERKGIRLFVRALEHFAKTEPARPEVILLGDSQDPELLKSSLASLKSAGFSVTHKGSLHSEQAMKFLRDNATSTLCVVPSPSDNFPYTVVEASLIPGLNLIASQGGGVPEILGHAEAQLCAPHPRDLAAKIAERLHSPLTDNELSHYDPAVSNERWLSFHQRALTSKATRQPRALPTAPPTVDVCTTYYRKAKYLPQFIDSLEHQTTSAFTLYAINDGSPDDHSVRVFDEQAARCAPRGWTFRTQANAFVDAARNHAARLGTGEYILFVDSDDIPAPNAVKRLRDALTLSGDDALIPSTFLFASDDAPYKLGTGEITKPSYAISIPLGMDLVGGLLHPAIFGGSMFIVRRSAFEAIGGFTEKPGAGHEDWELYVRLALAGFRVDVLPEMLQFYRQVEGSLARTLAALGSRRRLIDPYEEHLRPTGLGGAALALYGLYQSSRSMEQRIHALEARVNAPGAGFSYFSGHSDRFAHESETQGFKYKLQHLYRTRVSMETRLKIHRIFLAPFVGPYEPPSA